MSEGTCGVCPEFTLCLKALVVPLGVAMCLKRLVEIIIYCLKALVVNSDRYYSVSEEDCGTRHVSTQHL